jgi:hypothetical protein
MSWNEHTLTLFPSKRNQREGGNLKAILRPRRDLYILKAIWLIISLIIWLVLGEEEEEKDDDDDDGDATLGKS